ncbi:MAG TPA: hypothetical protein VMR41_05680 [Patescibacteria group bacterium]|nr:hypothetical protein [Patescibacteria group bacterium]
MNIEEYGEQYLPRGLRSVRLFFMGFVFGILLIIISSVSAHAQNIQTTPQASTGFNWLFALPIVLIVAGILYLISAAFSRLRVGDSDENDEEKTTIYGQPAYLGTKGGKARRNGEKIDQAKVKVKRKKKKN